MIVVWKGIKSDLDVGLRRRALPDTTPLAQFSILLSSYNTQYMGGNIASNEHLMENDLEERRVDDVEG
jgi:hypothetical protein